MSVNDNEFASIPKQAEAEHFYKRAELPVDFANWARESYWTAEQAVALSFGLEPDEFLWERLKAEADNSALAHRIWRFFQLVKRAQSIGDLPPSIPPHRYADFLEYRKIDSPKQLLDAIHEFGRPIPYWRELYEQCAVELSETRTALSERDESITKLRSGNDSLSRTLEAQRDESKELTEAERKSVKTIIITMATKKYGYDPVQARSSVVSQIVSDAHELGLRVEENTVRSWLAKSAKALRNSRA